MAQIGGCWAPTSWAVVAWAANTWSGAGASPAAGQTVQPFTVQTARQLFKKVAWDAEAKHTQPTDGRATRYDLAQPTLADQRQRLEATQRARTQAKQTRERMLWIASILPQLEDGE